MLFTCKTNLNVDCMFYKLTHSPTKSKSHENVIDPGTYSGVDGLRNT